MLQLLLYTEEMVDSPPMHADYNQAVGTTVHTDLSDECVLDLNRRSAQLRRLPDADSSPPS
jgi:hypothetical protein